MAGIDPVAFVMCMARADVQLDRHKVLICLESAIPLEYNFDIVVRSRGMAP